MFGGPVPRCLDIDGGASRFFMEPKLGSGRYAIASAMTRTAISRATREAVLLEAGYQCSNPVCRHIITLEMHHIEWVKDGGGNDPSNLLALCPNCHSLHTAGHIPANAIAVWKSVLLSLMNPHRGSADILLAISNDEQRFVGQEDESKIPARLRFTGDSLGFLSGLLSARLVEISRRFSGVNAWGSSLPSFEVRLTEKGRAFVAAWQEGNAGQLRIALGYGGDISGSS
jgi:hypothetical protein